MLTGMPQEQDIPAPVTTTIFFPLATDSEISDSVRLACESVDISSILRVTVIFATVMDRIKDSKYSSYYSTKHQSSVYYQMFVQAFKSRREGHVKDASVWNM